MAIFVIYGNVSFTTKQRRDSAVTFMRTEAVNRGFTQESPYAEYTPGVTPITWPDGQFGLIFCYQHTDEAVVIQTSIDMEAYLSANGRVDGTFGTSRVSG